jgi:hypothetical protein
MVEFHDLQEKIEALAVDFKTSSISRIEAHSSIPDAPNTVDTRPTA